MWCVIVPLLCPPKCLRLYIMYHTKADYRAHCVNVSVWRQKSDAAMFEKPFEKKKKTIILYYVRLMCAHT